MDIVAMILFGTEILGTVAFAVSGVMVAIEKNLDFFGAIVLGVTTAVGGGAFRDILLGFTPPLMFRNSTYVMIALAVSCFVLLLAYFLGDRLKKHKEYSAAAMNFFDAIGLGVFAVIGAGHAISAGYRDNWFLVIFVGAITGVGGGVIRDILAGQIPMILHKHIYALAAILGASLYYILILCGLGSTASMALGAGLVMLIRFLASHFRWSLPKISK